jgi:hypothetical protein
MAARTAVELVPEQVDATVAFAPGFPGSAPWVKAHPYRVAIRRRVGADVPAGAAVGGIQDQERARPVAVDGTLDAVVDALPGDACGVFVDAGTRPAVIPAGAAIEHVVLEIGAHVTIRAAATKVAGAALARLDGQQMDLRRGLQ